MSKEKLKKILRSTLKAIFMILIAGAISGIYISNAEKKRLEKEESIVESETTEGALDFIREETEITEEAEKTDEIPKYVCKYPTNKYEEWEYYVDNGYAYVVGYLGENKKEITLPKKISSYTLGGFTEGVCWYNKELEKITIPSVYKEVPTNAFIGCENLKEVNLSINTEIIGANAFEGCTSLKELHIGSMVNYIAGSALTGLSSLENLTVSENNQYYTSDGYALYSKNKEILYKVIKTDEVFEVKDGVREISSYAFSNNEKLKEVKFISSVYTIKEFAFYDCPNIKSITIHRNTNDIKPGAFYKCDGIESFNVDLGNRYYSSIDGLLLNYEEDILIAYPSGKKMDIFTIPENITNINSYAFIEPNVKVLNIPSSVNVVNSYAFIGGKDMSINIESNKGVFAKRAMSGWDKFFEGKVNYKN